MIKVLYLGIVNNKTNKAMPQFSIHTPKAQCDMKQIRMQYKMQKTTLPIGIIGQSTNFAYGYDGEKYYVTEYSILDYLVTNMNLFFEEAKYLFEALTFVGNPAPQPKLITKIIKSARKQKLTNQDLFWHIVDSL